MRDNFYLTLPINSSFDYFPENTTTCLKTQLPQRINLQGDFGVGLLLVEFHYPRSLLNITSTNIIVYYGEMNSGKMMKFKLAHGYYSVSDI